jgi:hypothetical protein
MAGHVGETVRLDSTAVRATQWYSEAMYTNNVSLWIPLACRRGGWACKEKQNQVVKIVRQNIYIQKHSVQHAYYFIVRL